jgi:hypothetical protein
VPFACWITKATDTHSEYVIQYCFSTATMVRQTHLNVTLYIRCLSRYMLSLVVHEENSCWALNSSTALSPLNI